MWASSDWIKQENLYKSASCFLLHNLIDRFQERSGASIMDDFCQTSLEWVSDTGTSMRYFIYSAQTQAQGQKQKTSTIFCLLCFLFWALLLSYPATARAKMVATTGENINMRSGPGTEYSALWQLGAGFPLEVLEQKGDWLQVRDFEGSVGWVNSSTVNSSPHVIVKVNKNSGQSINVRIHPSLDSDIVAKAAYGTVFKTLNRNNGWVRVEHRLGPVGWINESLLWGF